MSSNSAAINVVIGRNTGVTVDPKNVKINLNIKANNNISVTSTNNIAINTTLNDSTTNIDAGNELKITGKGTAIKNAGTLNLNQKYDTSADSKIIISGIVDNSGMFKAKANDITLGSDEQDSTNQEGLINKGSSELIANDAITITTKNGSAIDN